MAAVNFLFVLAVLSFSTSYAGNGRPHLRPKRNVEKLIVDIDPGTDDIEGLVMLINEHNKVNLEILAIVITDGNTEREHGIVNAIRLLEAANRLDIPVYGGSYLPILPHDEKLENFFGFDGFGDLPWESEPPTQRMQRKIATEAIHELVVQHPGEITYILLGPMTNLALCMRLYEGFAGKLKNIHSMAGLYNGDRERGEFNVLYDPESAEIVFSMLQSPMTIFSWQACIKNPPKRGWFDNATISNPVFQMVKRAEAALTEMHPDNPEWISCDPMAIATFLNDLIIMESYEDALMVNLSGVR